MNKEAISEFRRGSEHRKKISDGIGSEVLTACEFENVPASREIAPPL